MFYTAVNSISSNSNVAKHFFVAKFCTAGAMVVDKYVRWVGQVDG